MSFYRTIDPLVYSIRYQLGKNIQVLKYLLVTVIAAVSRENILQADASSVG